MTPRAAWATAVLLFIPGTGASLLGCRTPEPDPGSQGTAFAEIELSYEGCNCFEEVRELKLISRRLFGILPEVDEARQILHLRIREPRSLPLSEFVRAVDGTHALTRSLTIEAVISFHQEQALIHPTGQVLPVSGGAGMESGESRRRLKAISWRDPSQLRMIDCPYR